jgi:hypothetical protein
MKSPARYVQRAICPIKETFQKKEALFALPVGLRIK